MRSTWLRSNYYDDQKGETDGRLEQRGLEVFANTIVSLLQLARVRSLGECCKGA